MSRFRWSMQSALLFWGLAGCAAGTTRTVPRAPVTEGARAFPMPVPLFEDGDSEPEGEGPGELEDPLVQGPLAEAEPHPLEDVTDEELAQWVVEDTGDVGSASLGTTNAGALVGGVQMPPSPLWNVVNPRETWGTQETVDYLRRTIESVHREFPDTRPLDIGDMSKETGGYLRPHVSHQSGRDVDVGFYYTTDAKWYTTGGAHNLDIPRMWAFLRATVTETDVQAVFVDRRIQTLLRSYAESTGEEPLWLDRVFGGASTTERPLVLHEKGHRTHFHVRYYNPIAQETGRRVYPILLRHKKISPPTYFVRYKARRGDSLIKIARKFRVTVRALKRANRLRSNRIYARRTYRVPRKGGVRPNVQPLSLPARRLPPHTSGSAGTRSVGAP